MPKPLSPRQQFVRTTIISFGFLSGVWIHLGFDPQTFVYSVLQKILVAVQPQYAQAITTTFFVLPIILTCIAILGTYRKAGWFGLLSVAIAFVAGLLFALLSIPLLLLAMIIGFFAAKR